MTTGNLKFLFCFSDGMRKSNANSCVIWYDAVTIEGKLNWQNELNQKNKIFFDNCDAIFLNYTWKIENLENSIDNLADEGKDRKCDVYVGVDVFGRGCMGGGGFECWQPMKIIREKVFCLFFRLQNILSHFILHTLNLEAIEILF
jgi:mannosyl-glycoprotein endo-beta-N-acetylglucosaminidase